MRYLSVSHSANALLVRRGWFNPAESFVHGRNPRDKGARPRDKVQLFDVIKTAQSYLKITNYLGTTALACVVYKTRAFFVFLLLFFFFFFCFVFLSCICSRPLKSSGPDSRSNYYLTRNESTGGVRTLTECSADDY